jgi:hypothetical protein
MPLFEDLQLRREEERMSERAKLWYIYRCSAARSGARSTGVL